MADRSPSFKYAVPTMADLLRHEGHEVICVAYGRARHGDAPLTVAVECRTCNKVLLKFDNPGLTAEELSQRPVAGEPDMLYVVRFSQGDVSEPVLVTWDPAAAFDLATRKLESVLHLEGLIEPDKVYTYGELSLMLLRLRQHKPETAGYEVEPLLVPPRKRA